MHTFLLLTDIFVGKMGIKVFSL